MSINLQDCTAIEILLDAYHDGELAGDERASVEAHLQACESCPQKLAQISKLVSMLKDLPAAKSKIDFAERFVIPEPQPAHSFVPVPKSNVFSGRFAQIAAVAAVTILALGVGQYAMHHGAGKNEIANSNSPTAKPVQSSDASKHSLVAFYSSDPNTIPEELGISTDEDGLYAIKM